MIIRFMLTLLMVPVYIIFGIFGNDPDKPMYYVGLLFVMIYCLVVGIAGTALFVWIVLSGFHMIGTIATWF